MQTVIKNSLKARGLFVCRHPLHSRFNYEVSPYHVYEEKRCIDQGCVQFVWRCKIYGKSFHCPRGYKHVGRNCSMCKHYYEEKICRRPDLIVDPPAYEQYQRQLEDYRWWLSTVVGNKVPFSGIIDAVYPALERTIDNGRSQTYLRGFLLSFESAYIGYDLFDDRIYMRVGGNFISRYQPASGDHIDCLARLQTDRGRVVMTNPVQVDFTQKDDPQQITISRAQVGRATGSIVIDDISKCRGCPYGALLDVEVIRPKRNRYRRFYCLRGVSRTQDCPIRLDWELDEYRNQPAEI